MKKFITIICCLLFVYNVNAQVDSSYYTVRLSTFDASVNNNVTRLHWNTVCYLHYARFQIQKSTDGFNYETINTFTADKVRCQQPFDFTDSTSANQGKIYYKINVGNIDGKFYNSVIKQVYLKEKGFGIVSSYPTVATSAINFSLSNNKDAPVKATIINQNGVVIKQMNVTALKGVSNYRFNTSDLAPGTYWLQVKNNAGEIKTATFIKQ